MNRVLRMILYIKLKKQLKIILSNLKIIDLMLKIDLIEIVFILYNYLNNIIKININFSF
jgi:hypothetical protein